jgi:hypothetical protein
MSEEHLAHAEHVDEQPKSESGIAQTLCHCTSTHTLDNRLTGEEDYKGYQEPGLPI